MSAGKSQGGLGFRDLKYFNLAMLAKQGWRLISNPNSLAGRILKGRYYPNVEITQAKLGSNPSFTWRSIHQSFDILREGLRWRVGNGKQIKVWNEPWIPREDERALRLGSDQMVSTLKVRDLMSAEGASWDEGKVQAVIPVEEVTRVCSIPIFPDREDKLIWHFDKKGLYSVKSGYKVTKGRMESEIIVHQVDWNRVWKVNVPPKVRVFLWRALRHILPTRLRLGQKGLAIEDLCGCGNEPESASHALLWCDSARLVWEIWGKANWDEPMEFAAAFNYICRNPERNTVSEFAMLAWAIWWSRNQRLWRNQGMTAEAVYRKAMDQLEAWNKASVFRRQGVIASNQVEPAVSIQSQWDCYVDAAMFADPPARGTGAIIR